MIDKDFSGHPKLALIFDDDNNNIDDDFDDDDKVDENCFLNRIVDTSNDFLNLVNLD